jgi:hypothetical protein
MTPTLSQAATLVAASLLLSISASIQADEPAERIDLVCTEQPLKHVVFGADGKIDYREEPPREPAPVRLAVIKTSPGGKSEVEPARMESAVPYLQIDDAFWTAGGQVDSRNGLVRLDLQTNVLTVAETGTAGEAAFRHFQCERQPTQ